VHSGPEQSERAERTRVRTRGVGGVTEGEPAAVGAVIGGVASVRHRLHHGSPPTPPTYTLRSTNVRHHPRLETAQSEDWPGRVVERKIAN
jgi:hypothetical protein